MEKDLGDELSRQGLVSGLLNLRDLRSVDGQKIARSVLYNTTYAKRPARWINEVLDQRRRRLCLRVHARSLRRRRKRRPPNSLPLPTDRDLHDKTFNSYCT